MAPRHRECLVVWKPFGLTVRLVAGGNNHAFHRRSAAHGLQQVPGSTDVGLEGGHGISVSDADDRLRRQVDDGLDLVLVDHAFQ